VSALQVPFLQSVSSTLEFTSSSPVLQLGRSPVPSHLHLINLHMCFFEPRLWCTNQSGCGRLPWRVAHSSAAGTGVASDGVRSHEWCLQSATFWKRVSVAQNLLDTLICHCNESNHLCQRKRQIKIKRGKKRI
jgi:hypothetical protein